MRVVIGFDGDPVQETRLRAALVGLLDVFPQHLAKPRPPSGKETFDRNELAQNDHFDAILRGHKKDRLSIPIQALRAASTRYYGFDHIHPRRLAWFLPSILAAWLDRAPGPTDEPFGPSDIEAIAAEATDEDEGDWDWTVDEHAALAAFFEFALDAALATPLEEAREPAIERPREDGIRVWSLHSPSVPLEVLRVARALNVPLEPLVVRWSFDPSPLALDHLLEAVYDTTLASKHYLSHEAVAERLDSAFFEASGERQIRLSKAEATVRRNILRREDF